MAGPDWDALYSVAAAQEGHFTTDQAADAGFSSPLLHRHLRNGQVRRIRRGVYRLVRFPGGDHEDLVVVWLWSDRKGVFSHDTALSLHELSEALPARSHMTLPVSWSRRRLRVPKGLVLHHADLPEADQRWYGSVPVTAPARTVIDCARAYLPPDIVRQAIDDGLRRGLFDEAEVAVALEYLASLDGSSR